MSYNGSGTFQINSSGQPVVTGTVISSTAFNALTADLATGLSTAITKDGQTTTTARILFAQGISSTLVTDATSTTTGSIITAGGISCQKAAVVGTLLGVGMAPVNVLDITKNAAGAQYVNILNSNAGTSASAGYHASNGTSTFQLDQLGATYTSSGVFRQNGTLLYGDGAGGLTIDTGAAQPIYFGINNTEVARFFTGGGLGINTTNQSLFTGAGFPILCGLSDTAGRLLRFGNSNFNGTSTGTFSKIEYGAGTGNADLTITNTISGGTANGAIVFSGSSEYARFDTSGNLLVGTTSNWASARSEFRGTTNVLSAYNNGTVGGAIVVRVDTDTASLIDFYRGSSTQAGKFISTGGGTPNIQWLANNQAYVISGGSGGVTLASAATAWAAVSDETLKTDLALIQSGAEKVASLRAVTGRYKTDAESMSRSFLIAQDVQKVLPEAVSTDADGTLSLRYTEVIPLMVAAIQELTTRLAALENK